MGEHEDQYNAYNKTRTLSTKFMQIQKKEGTVASQCKNRHIKKDRLYVTTGIATQCGIGNSCFQLQVSSMIGSALLTLRKIESHQIQNTQD